MKWLSILLLLQVSSTPEAQDTETVVSGIITLKGDPPKSKFTKVSCTHCASFYPDGISREDVVVDAKHRVQWAFVFVESGIGSSFQLPKTSVVLDQKACRFEPHVLGMMAGQTLLIRNSDPHDQTVHILPFANEETSFAQLKDQKDSEHSFRHPEIMIKVKDDLHKWKSAWIGVLDHPFFAVSGSDGRYEIKGLPPGKYRLGAWHEKFGRISSEIEIQAGQKKVLDFAY